MAALTEKELARVAEIQKRINDGVKIQKQTQQELDGLLKKQIEHQKELNRQFSLGIKANKLAAEFSEKVKKSEEDTNKSISGRINNLLKGNVAQALGIDGMGKARKAQRNLNEEADAQAQKIQKRIGITNDQRVGLLGINKDIQSGLLNQKEAEDRIGGLGIKNSKIKGEMVNKSKKLTGLQTTSTKQTAASAARMAKFAKYGAIAGVVIGVMVKAITQFAAKIDEVGKTFGFLTSKNEQFRADLIAAGNEAIMIGKGLGDVLAVTAQLSAEFGLSLAEAGNLSNKVLDTAVATGLSNDEATKLFGTFMQIGNLTAQQAEDLIEGTAQLAAQRGVAPTAVLQDMAGSAEEIAKFTRGSGDNIAEAAIQARQLGLSLQTTAKISEGLLDFQNSISAEVEASVMIGRRLNFQRARQLSLEGDIAGATKEVVKQLGSEEELNKLNVLQRNSIAKSIGVSATELTKLIRGQDKLTLSTALTGKKFDDLVGQDSLSTLTNIVNSIKSIGATLLDTFGGPVNAFLEKFRDNFSGPEGVAKLRARVISIGTVLIQLMNGIGNFLDLFIRGDAFQAIDPSKVFGSFATTNDYRGGRGGISVMAGPAGVFRLNPMDSVIATTNPIPTNDYGPQPAGSVGMNQKIEVTGTLTGQRGALMASIETPLG